MTERLSKVNNYFYDRIFSPLGHPITRACPIGRPSLGIAFPMCALGRQPRVGAPTCLGSDPLLSYPAVAVRTGGRQPQLQSSAGVQLEARLRRGRLRGYRNCVMLATRRRGVAGAQARAARWRIAFPSRCAASRAYVTACLRLGPWGDSLSFPGRKIGEIADKIKAEMMSKGFAVASERSNGAGVAGASTFNDTADISPVRSFR